MRRLYQITLPHATFGLEVHDGRVVRAAPIAHWTVGKQEADVLRYYRRYADHSPVPWSPIRLIWEASRQRWSDVLSDFLRDHLISPSPSGDDEDS